MFNSQTYGKLKIETVPNKLLEFFDRNKEFDRPFQIIIGTDSQTEKETKIVTVISILCEGHGGIFFYQATMIPRVHDVRTKLHMETNDSLEVASQLVEILENDPKYEELFLACPISIHIDAGNSPHGKTAVLIPELVGWIKSCGYECEVKPDSFVASTIADKISK